MNLTAFETRLSRSCASRARSPARSGSGLVASVERDLLLLGERPRGLDRLGRDRREVDRADLEGELARLDLGEEEEVADKVEEPVRVSLDHTQELALLVRDLARLAVEDELEVAADRGQRRAELVRDEGDELVLQVVELEQALVSHLELARELLSFLLQPPAVGDVLCDCRDADDLACAVANRGHGHRDVDQRSVLAPSCHFEAALAQLDHRCDARARIRRLPFRDEDRARLSDHLFGCVAEHLLGALVPARDDAVEVRGRDRVVGRFDDRSELEALELPETPVRHVEDRAVETNAPVRSGYGLPALDDVANRPVAVDDAVVRRIRPSALDGGGDFRLEPLAVVGVDDAGECPRRGCR